MHPSLTVVLCSILAGVACAPTALAHPDEHPWRPKVVLPRTDPFARLDDADLPTPNQFRTAAGTPGPAYWQQQVDYDIDVRLNVPDRRIEGTEHIHYVNNSPDTLTYLWVQLEQNQYRAGSRGRLSAKRERGSPPCPSTSTRLTTPPSPSQQI